jgi:hypothetical protein
VAEPGFRHSYSWRLFPHERTEMDFRHGAMQNKQLIGMHSYLSTEVVLAMNTEMWSQK